MPRRSRRTCKCCNWKQHMIDRDGDDPSQIICDDCSSHYSMKLEPLERTLDREAAHAAMWQEIARQIGDKFDHLKINLEDEQVAAFNARETKRRYEEILDDLSDLHQRGEKKRCSCGVAWPCETGALLERRYGRTYARRKVASEAKRQRLIEAGLDPDQEDDAEDLTAQLLSPGRSGKRL